MVRKGYVIVDMPDGCDECQLCSYDDMGGCMSFICCGKIDNGYWFVNISEEIMDSGTKPDWCPIRQLPTPPDGNYDYVEGYVDCLLDIIND